MEAKIQATKVFQKNLEAFNTPGIRFIVNQGGSRSSKTYSIAQLFIILMLQGEGLLTIARKTLPALKGSAMRDFFEIMNNIGIYEEKQHNKTELTYGAGNQEVEFLSVDQPQKIRGRKRRKLWMNEANEFTYEDFQQLNIRTTEKIFLDYNPSDEFHWIYDQIVPRKDSVFIQSTYLDNPFLEVELRKEIERLKDVDPNYWRIYGLGEKGVSETTIYTHWQYCDSLPDSENIMGLDFGFNHPTALTNVVIKDDNIYTHEKIYESGLTNQELIKKMDDLKISKQTYIYADSEDPSRIMEIRRAGYNIREAKKGKDSVKAGIDMIKAKKFYITKESTNGIKELKSYKWKTKDDKILDDPIKLNDDFLDSVRYSVFTHLGRPKHRIFENKPAGW